LSTKTNLKTEKVGSDYVIDLSSATKENYATVIVADIKGKPVIYDAPEIKSSSNIFIDQIPVSFITHIPGAVIHYTINGEEPSLSSPIATKTLVVKKSVTIKAKCFLREKPITPTSAASFEKVIAAPAINISLPAAGLNYSIYNGEWSKLPDFDELSSAAAGIVKTIDISAKHGSDKYGFMFDGLIKIPIDGVYTFYISSDDGSKLFIDDKMVIDNDGLQGLSEKTNEVPLAKGYHPIKILFFERTGGDDLQVQWKGPGFQKKIIPASVLFRK
jgi:alpha-L-fucosidase